MFSAVIWGMGYTYNQYINAIKYQELLGRIKISGVTGREDIYEFLDGYPFIWTSPAPPGWTAPGGSTR